MPDLYPIARKLLFTLDAETAHHTTLSMMSAAKSCGILSLVAGPPLQSGQESCTVEVMGLKFPNRVGLAAGLDKAGTVVGAFGDVGFGHIEIGTVTPRPQPGNNKPRLFRLKEYHAVINRMGFNNPGIEVFFRISNTPVKISPVSLELISGRIRTLPTKITSKTTSPALRAFTAPQTMSRPIFLPQILQDFVICKAPKPAVN